MTCKEVRRKLSTFQDHELIEPQAAEIKDHLQTCPNCVRIYRELTRVWEVLAQVETFESSPFFWMRLSQRIQQGKGRQSSWQIALHPFRGFMRPAFSALVIFLGLILGIYLGQNIYQHSMAKTEIRAEQEWDQMLSLGSFDDLPKESVANIYVSLISENNQSQDNQNE